MKAIYSPEETVMSTGGWLTRRNTQVAAREHTVRFSTFFFRAIRSTTRADQSSVRCVSTDVEQIADHGANLRKENCTYVANRLVDNLGRVNDGAEVALSNRIGGQTNGV